MNEKEVGMDHLEVKIHWYILAMFNLLMLKKTKILKSLIQIMVVTSLIAKQF